MNALRREVEAVQNPALGAVLLWRFACGCCPAEAARAPVPLPLLFLVLPILLHAEMRGLVESTQAASGLHKFVDKFSSTKEKKSDLLLAIHDRALALRALTRESLGMAVATSLLLLDLPAAGVWPVSYTSPGPRQVPPGVGPLLKGAQKLGAWCAPHTLFEITRLFRTVL